VQWAGSAPQAWAEQNAEPNNIAFMRLGEADGTPIRIPASDVILTGAAPGQTEHDWKCPR
jgi:hypothetical protein